MRENFLFACYLVNGDCACSVIVSINIRLFSLIFKYWHSYYYAFFGCTLNWKRLLY